MMTNIRIRELKKDNAQDRRFWKFGTAVKFDHDD